LEILELNECDVIILDWDLAGEQGLSILKSFRQQGITTPILALSYRGDVQSHVQALDNGVDDYMLKPAETEELMARIRALRRRNTEVYYSNEYVIGTLVFSPEQCLIKQGYKQAALTLKESMIFETANQKP
jgi:DNA-binding response OmpR family regulator